MTTTEQTYAQQIQERETLAAISHLQQQLNEVESAYASMRYISSTMPGRNEATQALRVLRFEIEMTIKEARESIAPVA